MKGAFPMTEYEVLVETINPVSYTHLDVYKGQPDT